MWRLTKSRVIVASAFLFFILFLSFKSIKIPTAVNYLDNHTDLIIRDNEHYLSNVPGSTFTIVEYFDFDCIFCQRLHLLAKKEGIDYSTVTYILRPYPSTDKKISPYKSLVAECIYEQSGDKGYLAFLDKYYEVWGDKSDLDWAVDLAKAEVDNTLELEECILSNDEVKKRLSIYYSFDSVNGFASTPSFFVYKEGVLEQSFGSLGIKLYKSLIEYYSNKSGA